MEDEDRISGSSDFGALLRRHRLAAGLSQEALAERARMSSDGISALERGHRRTPQRETLALLIGALALSDGERQAFETAALRPSMLRRGASVTVGPWSDVVTASLPLSLTSFVGRETELEEIATLLREHRLVTLTGGGGVGKTQTALRVATALEPADGTTRFVALGPISDSSLVLVAIASALGAQEVPNRPLLKTVLAHLRSRSMLIILDNCEHVIIEAANIATALLSSCPLIRILATSRERLKAPGEYAYRLPSLDSLSAMKLFSARAQAVNHQFALTDETSPTVAEICRRLDGIPLAIELAAARANLLSVKALAKKLDDRFHVLAGGERTALPRHQTMRATIDWSYELLSLPEQRVFERLSVFAGGCTLDMAAMVCCDHEISERDTFALLSALVDKSLLVVEFQGLESRYVLLESFREYALEKLAARGERDYVERRHALAFLELSQRFEHALFYESDEVAGELARSEIDNWRAALVWALASGGDVLLGQRLVGQLTIWFWIFADSISREGRRWLSLALERLDESTPVEVRARLYLLEAAMALNFGEVAKILAPSQRALEAFRVADDPVGAARAQVCVANHLSGVGRLAEAKGMLQDLLPAVGRMGSWRLSAMVTWRLGYICAAQGELDMARRLVAEAQEYYVVGRYLAGFLAAAETLCLVEFQAGNVELALRYVTDAVAMHRDAVDRATLVSSLEPVPPLLTLLARYDEAAQTASEMLVLSREAGMDGRVAMALEDIATIATLRSVESANDGNDKLVSASRILGFADARLTELGSRRGGIRDRTYPLAIAALRDAIGAETAAKLMGQGMTISEEQIVKEASNLL